MGSHACSSKPLQGLAGFPASKGETRAEIQGAGISSFAIQAKQEDSIASGRVCVCVCVCLWCVCVCVFVCVSAFLRGSNCRTQGPLAAHGHWRSGIKVR